MFGKTAKMWREESPDLKGNNIRKNLKNITLKMYFLSFFLKKVKHTPLHQAFFFAYNLLVLICSHSRFLSLSLCPQFAEL